MILYDRLVGRDGLAKGAVTSFGPGPRRSLSARRGAASGLSQRFFGRPIAPRGDQSSQEFQTAGRPGTRPEKGDRSAAVEGARFTEAVGEV